MLHFIVDTTFGITKEYAEKHGIRTVSLKMILDGVVTPAGFPNEWGEFYGRFETSKNFPTTSQPNPEDFAVAINEVLAADANAEIVIMTIASALSGTSNSARLAALMFPHNKIAVIDTMCASLCETIMLETLVEAAENGKSFDEVCALAEELKPRLSMYFVPDSMKYLEKGGRIGKLGAILASTIQIKPIFEFKNNVVAVAKKVIGMPSALNEMVRRAAFGFKRIIVAYIHNSKHVTALVEKVKSATGLGNVEVRKVDPVFGVHVGIGAIGIACLNS